MYPMAPGRFMTEIHDGHPHTQHQGPCLRHLQGCEAPTSISDPEETVTKSCAKPAPNAKPTPEISSAGCQNLCWLALKQHAAQRILSSMDIWSRKAGPSRRRRAPSHFILGLC